MKNKNYYEFYVYNKFFDTQCCMFYFIQFVILNVCYLECGKNENHTNFFPIHFLSLIFHIKRRVSKKFNLPSLCQQSVHSSIHNTLLIEYCNEFFINYSNQLVNKCDEIPIFNILWQSSKAAKYYWFTDCFFDVERNYFWYSSTLSYSHQFKQ